jgi:hypothetical protein
MRCRASVRITFGEKTMIKKFSRIFKSRLQKRIYGVEDRLRTHLEPKRYTKLWIHHFGATYIDPKHLAICIAVGTDEEVENLDLQGVAKMVHTWLEEEGYPHEAIKHVGVRVDSQETVDRDFEGNWFHCYK